MKKQFLYIVAVFVGLSVSAQKWTANLPTVKSSSPPTFFEYQDAFNSYWEPYKVKNGYYTNNQGVVKKAYGWKQFKRWEYYWETRVNALSGEFPSANLNAIYRLENLDNAFKSSGELWSSKGPFTSEGGYAGIGRINVIAYHPTNANMFWAGTASGGLWVTSDGGQNWTVLNDNMQALGVSDIIIPSDYETSKTIYLATGDRDAYDTRSIGLLKSTDAGATWQSHELDFTTNQGAIINRVLIDPSNNTTLIVAGNFGVLKSYRSFLKSGQEITAWAQISSNVFIDMEYKPGDFNTLYGATKRGGIFVSRDGGATWVQNHNQGYRTELAVSAAQPDWVYAVIANADDGLHGVYKSIDAGLTFTKVFDGALSGKNLLGWDNGTDEGGQGWYDLAIAASPSNANTLFVGGINTWKSTDGGLTFTMVNHWYGGYGSPEAHADKHYLGYQPVTGVLFEANDGGIYKTSDNITWTDLSNGIVNSQIYKLGISKTVPGETIAGLQDNGTKLLYLGADWYDVKGGDGTECIIDYTNANVQYGAYVNGQVSKTTNRWTNTTDISAKIPGGADGAWVTPYLLNPVDPLKIYIGYKEIWKSVNGGSTFTKISNFQGNYLRSLAIAPSDTAIVYAATYTKIDKTTNSGQTWTNITGYLPVASNSLTSIAVKHNDPNTVWVTFSGYAGNGVYQSIDGGTSWTNISAGLPQIPCNTLVQNRQNTSQLELYAGTDIGVYLKLGSNPWTFFSTGLPNVNVSELEIYYHPTTPKESLLKAATYGRGLWETKVYSAGTQTGIHTIEKIGATIFPNPSNGQFTLSFQELDNEGVDIEINSLSGKTIYQNHFNQTQLTIDLGKIANGVYVLRIKKGGDWFGQKIVIQD